MKNFLIQYYPVRFTACCYVFDEHEALRGKKNPKDTHKINLSQAFFQRTLNKKVPRGQKLCKKCWNKLNDTLTLHQDG